MANNRPYYVYNPNRESHYQRAEDEVMKKDEGYPFVSLTVLEPGNGLGVHRHNSRNTHLIVIGQMNIAPTTDGEWKGNPKRSHTAGDWITLEADVDYMGMAAAHGCSFVEGHSELSPTTATRFFKRRTIVKATRKTPGAFTTAEGGCVFNAEKDCMVHDPFGTHPRGCRPKCCYSCG